jgi:hypothetical protein
MLNNRRDKYPSQTKPQEFQGLSILYSHAQLKPQPAFPQKNKNWRSYRIVKFRARNCSKGCLEIIQGVIISDIL